MHMQSYPSSLYDNLVELNLRHLANDVIIYAADTDYKDMHHGIDKVVSCKNSSRSLICNTLHRRDLHTQCPRLASKVFTISCH